MRALVALALIPFLVGVALPAQLAVSGPNQGMTVYCSGAGCTAYGTPVLDLSDSTNWTLFQRVRFDPNIGNSTHFTFSQSTLVGGAFTCPGVFTAAVGPGATFHFVVFVTLAGGISSSTVLASSANLTPGLWYALAVTHDSSHNWSIYINGELDSTTNSSVTIGSGCDTFIGTVSGATDCGSPGLGGDVGCWINDVALFPAAFGLGDNRGLYGSRPDLVSVKPSIWYAMDGSSPIGCSGSLGAGFPDPDSSGNQHTLKLGDNGAEDYCQTGAQTNGTVMPPTGEATH